MDKRRIFCTCDTGKEQELEYGLFYAGDLGEEYAGLVFRVHFDDGDFPQVELDAEKSGPVPSGFDSEKMLSGVREAFNEGIDALECPKCGGEAWIQFPYDADRDAAMQKIFDSCPNAGRKPVEPPKLNLTNIEGLAGQAKRFRDEVEIEDDGTEQGT